MNPNTLDSFVFDISLFDYPIIDYKESYNSTQTVNLALIAVKLLDIVQAKNYQNMFELKAYLFNYLALHVKMPINNNYPEDSEIARMFHFIDRSIVFYIELTKQDNTKRELRQRFLKFVIADLYFAEAVCL
jgi:hypothetical protein